MSAGSGAPSSPSCSRGSCTSPRPGLRCARPTRFLLTWSSRTRCQRGDEYREGLAGPAFLRLLVNPLGPALIGAHALSAFRALRWSCGAGTLSSWSMFGSAPMSLVIFCPSCKTRLTLGDDRAGQEIECPSCDQSIRLPALLPPPPPPSAPPPPPARSRTASDSDRDSDDYEPAPRRRRRRDDDDDDDDRPVRSRPRRRIGCPNCGSDAVPFIRTRISTAGWIVFALLLIFTVCFFWIGLLIKEQYRVCPECGCELP
jgi:hypothetical protein